MINRFFMFAMFFCCTDTASVSPDAFFSCLSLYRGSIASFLYGFYDGCRIGLFFLKFYLHAVCQQVYHYFIYAIHFRDAFFNMGRAGRTAHASHVKTFFQLFALSFISLISEADRTVRPLPLLFPHGCLPKHNF